MLPPRRPRDPLFGGSAWDEDDDEEEFDGSSLAQPPQDFAFGFGFGPGPGVSRGSFEELFRDVGELLGISGGAWAGPPQPFGGDGEELLLRGLSRALGADAEPLAQPDLTRPPFAPQSPSCPAPARAARGGRCGTPC